MGINTLKDILLAAAQLEFNSMVTQEGKQVFLLIIH